MSLAAVTNDRFVERTTVTTVTEKVKVNMPPNSVIRFQQQGWDESREFLVEHVHLEFTWKPAAGKWEDPEGCFVTARERSASGEWDEVSERGWYGAPMRAALGRTIAAVRPRLAYGSYRRLAA